jgi:iron complex outermembrane recepter protein
MTTRVRPGDSIRTGASAEANGLKLDAAGRAARECCGSLIPILRHVQRIAPLLLASVVSLGAGAFAEAQTAPPPAAGQSTAPPAAAGESTAENSGQLTEVIVTAQRRNENLQSVPITVTAVNASQLEQAGATSIADINVAVPGVNFIEEAAWAQPFIRGIGQDTNGPGIENSVATYVDGVYQGSMVGGASDFNNVESVQVLSGPQGTLFGRNATGGAILITTKTPSQTFGGEASVGYGNYNTVIGSAYVTGGVANTLAADVAVDWTNQGTGYGRNLLNGDDIAKNRKLFVRSKWLYTPSDRVTFTLALDYGHVNFETDQAPAPGTTPPGGAPVLPPYDIDGVYNPEGYVNEGGAALTVDVDLQPLRFKSITAYRDTSSLTTENGWLSPNVNFDQYLYLFEPHIQESQEFQLLSPSEWRLHWTAGLYYFHEHSGYNPVDLIYSPTNVIIFPLTEIQEYSNNSTNSYAAYGEATYDVQSDTHLTAGVRYTVEQRSFALDEILLGPDGANFGSFPASGDKRFSAPSWRLVLDHNFTANILGYVSYNRGFKSGGWNAAVAPALSFEPEKLDAYELGLKTLSFDDHLRLNVSGFYYNDKNIQVEEFPPPEGILTITNGPDAHLYGIDILGDAALTDHLTLRFGANLLHAYFASYPDAFLTSPIPGGGTAFSTFNAQGYPVPHAPRATWSVGPDYAIPTQIGTFRLDAEYYHNSGWNAEPDGRLHQDGYSIVNSQLAWVMPNGKYEVDLWGKNLQNTAYAYTLLTNSAGDAIFWAPPRTYGITLRANF